MALVNNPNWIGFDGTPVTGRAPAMVVMMAGDMTPALQAEIQHVYLLFCLAKNVAVVDYFVTDRMLRDGSRVRITSMQDRDKVQVWTKKAERPVLLGYESLQFDWQQLRERVHSSHLYPTWNGIYTTPQPPRYTSFKNTPAQGIVSWSSPAIAVGDRAIQLTYGERSMISYQYALYGTERLWIDGSKVKLHTVAGVETVFAFAAACLVKVPFAGNVGYVLRLLRVDTFDKKLSFVDFGLFSNQQPILNIGALGETIELRERITRDGPPYWAANAVEAQYLLDWGWGHPVTRFCFNGSGTKVACSAILWDEAVETTREGSDGRHQGTGIVEIDAMTGVLSKTFPCEREDAEVQSINVSTGWIGTVAAQTLRVRTVLMAVDYEGDTLVWILKKITQVRESNYTKPNGPSAHLTLSDVFTTTVVHSRLGKLLELIHQSGVETSGNSGGGGSISWRGGYRYMDVSFGGDLSRRGFCIGYADELSMQAASGTYDRKDGSDIYFKGVTMPLKRVRMKVDVYLQSRKVATGLPGPSVFRVHIPMYVSTLSRFTAEGEDVVVQDVGHGGIGLNGITSQPEDNGTYTDRVRLRLGLIPNMYMDSPPMLSYVVPTDFAGFYNQVEAPVVFCAVAPSGNAIYMDSIDEPPPMAGKRWPGLSHLVRKCVKGVECFALSYEGYTTTTTPEHYIQVASGGLFLNHRRVYS
jgi:hypothetical protein